MRATGLLAAASLLAPTVCGCFGSSYAAEGNHGAAASVRAADIVGLGLIAWSASLMSDSDEEGTVFLHEAIVPVLPGALGIAMICYAESSYYRDERRDIALDRVDRLREPSRAQGREMLSREKLKGTSPKHIERYERVQGMRLREPEVFASLNRQRIIGWPLVIGGIALANGVTDGKEDLTTGEEVLAITGTVMLLSGLVMILRYESAVNTGAPERKSRFMVMPNGAAFALRF